MKRRQGKIGNAVCHVYLLILTSIAVFPLLWILISSIKGKGELTGNPTGFLPKTVTLDYFEHVIHDLGFITNIKNSIIISLITTVIAITIASMAAYGIVRFFPRVGAIMSRFLVTTYIFPPILLAIPYSIVTDEYKSWFDYCLFILQYSICRMAVGRILQKRSDWNRGSSPYRWCK